MAIMETRTVFVSIPREGRVETWPFSNVHSKITAGELEAHLLGVIPIERGSFCFAWKGCSVPDKEIISEQVNFVAPLELRLRVRGGGTGSSTHRPPSDSKFASSLRQKTAATRTSPSSQEAQHSSKPGVHPLSSVSSSRGKEKQTGSVKSKSHLNVQKTAWEPNHKLSSKFASDELKRGVYGDFKTDFRQGVEGALGLPGSDVYAGMKMEFCSSEDSETSFTIASGFSTNSAAPLNILTTPKQEYEFVVNPVSGKDYGGGRKPISLKCFLYASSAKEANGECNHEDHRRNAEDSREEHGYAKPLDGIHPSLKDGVEQVLLQQLKEVGLTKSLLEEAAKNAKISTDRDVLKKFAKMPDGQRKALQEELGKALDNLPLRSMDKGPSGNEKSESYSQGICKLLTGVKHVELDVLLRSTRQHLKRADLHEEEVIALRLYTGPAYTMLNQVLRTSGVGGKADRRVAKGNNYVSTIFAAVSGMVKLAEISPIPPRRVVYRGTHGMKLPEWVTESDPVGVKGGTEMAFLSTTTDIQIAKSYASKGQNPIVFAIQVGAVDKGAALGFISQFPNEREILMPPRSYLEVTGEPSFDPKLGATLVHLKLNCNLFCPTLDEVRKNRKTALVTILNTMRKEIVRDVDELVKKEEVKERAKEDIFWQSSAAYRDKFLDSIKEEAEKALKAADARKESWYNVDVQFRRAMQEALAVQRKAMGKFQLWLQDHTLDVEGLTEKTALECDRMGAGRLLRLIEDVDIKITDCGTESRKSWQRSHFVQQKIAMVTKLCEQKDLIHRDVNEVLDLSNGETALMLQAAQGNEVALMWLLEAGAKVDQARRGGDTALHIAATCGNTGVVKILWKYMQSTLEVSEGSNPADIRNDIGETALSQAAQNGHVETLRFLLRTCKADGACADAVGYSAVNWAALRGHLEALKVLLDSNNYEDLDESRRPDINVADKDGWTPVMMAAQNGHLAVVKWLVQNKADVLANSTKGKTAFLVASEKGRELVVKWLAEITETDHGIKTELDINAKAWETGRTALMLTAANEFDSLSRWLVEEKGADVHAVDRDGYTALMLAVEKGHDGLVKWLEERGADVNVRLNDGCTALMLAAENGHLGLAKWLVEHREADVDAEQDDGTTAVILAAKGGHEEVTKWLVEEKGADPKKTNQGGRTALLEAALVGSQELVRWLVEEREADLQDYSWDQANNADNNTVKKLAGGELAQRGGDEDSDNWDELARDAEKEFQIYIVSSRGTTLINAASNGHEDLVRWLVEEQPVSIDHEFGMTALMSAASNGHLAVVKWLGQNKADVSRISFTGRRTGRRTALMMACLSGTIDVVQWLLKSITDKGEAESKHQMELADYHGWTALLFVCANNWSEEQKIQILKELVQNGANVHARVGDGGAEWDGGWTALLCSALRGNVGLAKWLVEKHDADVNETNEKGSTALMLAAKSGSMDLVEWLVTERKAKVTTVNNKGQTALDFAAFRGHKKMVKFLLYAELERECASEKECSRAEDGRTLLMLAAQSGHEDLVKWLANHHTTSTGYHTASNFNERDKEGLTVLSYAAIGGHLGLVKWLVAGKKGGGRERANVNSADNHGNTPLMWAATAAKYAVVGWLVDPEGGKADPAARDIKGRTALLLACESGYEGCVRSLWHITASVTSANQERDETTALMLAARNGHEGLVKWLVNVQDIECNTTNTEGETALLCAADSVDGGPWEGVVKWLVNKKTDVNRRRKDGKTALILLAMNGHRRLVAWMVKEAYAEVNARDESGMSALMWAIKKGFADVATILEGGGGDRLNFKFTDNRGFTALMLGLESREETTSNLPFVKWLVIDHGAQVDAISSDGEGWTPLTLAIKAGNSSVAKWIVKENDSVLKAELEDINAGRQDPLILAIQMDDADSEEIAKDLVERGANVKAVDKWGNTALMYAVNNRQKDKVQLLLQAGAEVKTSNLLGWNALHVAILTDPSQQELVPLLIGKCSSNLGAIGLRVKELEQDNPLVVVRGTPLGALIHEEDQTVTFGQEFSTMRNNKQSCKTRCKAYYELTIIGDIRITQFGFATSKMACSREESVHGVGDDNESWAVDGFRCQTWPASEATAEYNVEWQAGDVIGLACDLERNEILVSVNGTFWPALPGPRPGEELGRQPDQDPPPPTATDPPTPGAVFKWDAESAPKELYPAFTAGDGVVKWNFGERAFKYPPPFPDFRPFASLPVASAERTKPKPKPKSGARKTEIAPASRPGEDEALQTDSLVSAAASHLTPTPPASPEIVRGKPSAGPWPRPHVRVSRSSSASGSASGSVGGRSSKKSTTSTQETSVGAQPARKDSI